MTHETLPVINCGLCSSCYSCLCFLPVIGSPHIPSNCEVHGCSCSQSELLGLFRHSWRRVHLHHLNTQLVGRLNNLGLAHLLHLTSLIFLTCSPGTVVFKFIITSLLPLVSSFSSCAFGSPCLRHWRLASLYLLKNSAHFDPPCSDPIGSTCRCLAFLV